MHIFLDQIIYACGRYCCKASFAEMQTHEFGHTCCALKAT